MLQAGEHTGEGFIGAGDLDILLAACGDTATAGVATEGDLTGDGLVRAADLDLLLCH